MKEVEATVSDTLPKSCYHLLKISGDGLLLLFAWKVELLEQLRGVMTDAEIIAASNEEQPALDKMRAITCRRCNDFECPLNPRFRPSDSFSDLMDGQWWDRCQKGDQLVAQFLPEDKKTELEKEGIKCVAFHMASRKNPKLIFSFILGEKTRRSVSCEIGKRLLRTDKGEERLLSIEQLGQKIEEAIVALQVG